MLRADTLRIGSEILGSIARVDEVKGARRAELMEQVFSAWQDIPLTEPSIQQLNPTLLQHGETAARRRGRYQQSSNSVAAFDEHGVQIGAVFQTAARFETSRPMTERTPGSPKSGEMRVSIP